MVINRGVAHYIRECQLTLPSLFQNKLDADEVTREADGEIRVINEVDRC